MEEDCENQQQVFYIVFQNLIVIRQEYNWKELKLHTSNK